jgi:glutaredoxin 3
MITVYTKNYCPYCVKAKGLLNSLDVQFEEIDITSTPELIDELSAKSGLKTVPQIFVDDKCLGGYSDIEALQVEGKLMDALKG